MADTTSLRGLGTRVLAYTVGLAALAGVIAPMTWERPRDSFPLSSYPMFSSSRDRESQIATVVGVDFEGERVVLDPWLIGGSDEVILASATVWRAVAGGSESSERLCREVAERLESRSHSAAPVPEWLEVAAERFDTVAYFRGETAPKARDVFARCRVARGEP